MQFISRDLSPEGVLTVGINRPKQLNALNTALLNELLEAFKPDSAVRSVLLRSEIEKAFVAGADISELSPEVASLGHQVMMRIEEFPAPVVVEVNGYALGGGLELALSCDLICCGPNAVFGLVETSLGLIPGFGGTVRLSSRIGLQLSKRLILTGEKLTADEAAAIGLVDYFFEEELQRESALLAAQLATGPTKAYVSIKNLFRANQEALINEEKEFSELLSSIDAGEGREAFLAKRKPDFIGK